ncbi:SDH family Clp fold serine proteinase, partial [Dokdonella sp.]|uniref:SDH family Clp fold serine proteinase n=1 Tax=Dokdonella sp. TaxID=2291710 RepID=UPI002F42A756
MSADAIAQASWSAIERIERLRGNPVLVLFATTIDRDILPDLHEACMSIGRTDRLDVVLITRGGVVNDARRVALMLRSVAGHLAFIVPHHCESSGTLLALAADEIVAGDLAIFSPIDPHLDGAVGGEASSLSWLDVTSFSEMADAWFSIDRRQAGVELLRLLCASVSAHALTMFYRASKEMHDTALELMAHPLRRASSTQRERIVSELMGGYRSHNYAITAQQLAGLGLNVARDTHVEEAAWALAMCLREHLAS